ncbi:hypothetical protein IP88_10405 [alpha proteobacterium AAP81b]|nr:hypothetical protein IP88_10405 [alpha proteobacterium AAP81b]
MKTILVHIADDDGFESRLQAAFDLARAFGGHLICQQATPYAAYAMGGPGLGAFPITELVTAVEAARDALRQRVEAHLMAEGVSWDYHLVDGDPGDWLVTTARLADVVVMSAGKFGGTGGFGVAETGDIAVRAPAPVLAVPPGGRGVAVTGAAVVAWDGTQEAALAMRAALPMLRLAESVELLTIAEKTSGFAGRDAAAFLSRHGIHAELTTRPALDAGIDATLRAALVERRAAWLVLGAYGHSRLREMLLGGVTRSLIGEAPLPLLLAH